MLNILIDCDKSFIPKAYYVFETFFTYYKAKIKFYYKFEDIDNNEKTLIYSNKKIPIVENKKYIFFFQSEETIEFFINNKKITKDQISDLDSLNPMFKCKKRENSEKFDLIASIFYFLSAWQEKDNIIYENKGRFLAKDSIQYAAGKLEVPLVDIWFEILAKKISTLGIKLNKVNQLYDKRNILNLSHDIDFVYESHTKLFHLTKKKLYNVIKNKKNTNLPSYSIYRFLSYKQKKILDILYRLTFEKGFSSTFNIMMEYNSFDLKAVYRLCKIVDGSNSEIGIHPTVADLNDSNFDNLINKFKEKYKVRNIYGMRIHELAFSPDRLYNKLDSTDGILYDNSMMFHDLPGFRTSFSLPHKFFCKNKNTILNVLSIPIFSMDTSFTKYMHLNEKETEESIDKIVQENINKGGITSILIHNNFFYSRTKHRINLYKKWINQIFESEGSIVSTRDLFFWHNKLNKSFSNQLK